MINPKTTGTLPNHIFLMDSFDDGRTWANRREVDTRPFPSVALMGAPLVLAAGVYRNPPDCAPVAVVSEAWKTYDDAGYGEHSAILSISHDGGYTFDPATVVAHDPANRLLFWDERLAVDPETGRLIAMLWTHDRVAQLDVNVHIAWSQTADGKSWSYPRDAGFAGQLPRPLPLPGGRVLCVYVHRHWPPSLRAILSPDFGKTWDASGELVFYEYPYGPQAGMDGQREFTDYYEDMRVWNFGLVEPGLLPDGNVFAAFYAGDAQSLSIRWARLAV
ncbi:MAG: hypothetical protein CVU38_10490 [Chloroflexi bacterium HGW-Chloroflexi-1]|nr:MAG: hypothetical protein CVU38_10490 [Chloroflexi bacterium HGW-Chloroflexi-1]